MILIQVLQCSDSPPGSFVRPRVPINRLVSKGFLSITVRRCCNVNIVGQGDEPWTLDRSNSQSGDKYWPKSTTRGSYFLLSVVSKWFHIYLLNVRCQRVDMSSVNKPVESNIDQSQHIFSSFNSFQVIDKGEVTHLFAQTLWVWLSSFRHTPLFS